MMLSNLFVHYNTGQISGVEAAIHSMHDVYDLEVTEAVLLIDAEKCF